MVKKTAEQTINAAQIREDRYRHGFRCKQVELRYRPVPNGDRK